MFVSRQMSGELVFAGNFEVTDIKNLNSDENVFNLKIIIKFIQNAIFLLF